MSLLASSNTTNIPNNKKRKEPSSSSNHHQQQDNINKRVKRSNGNSSPLHHSRHQHHDSQDELNFSSTMDDYDNNNNNNKGDEEMSLSQYSSSTTGGGHHNDVSQGGGDYSQSQSQPSESVHDESFIQSQPIISQTQPTTTLNTKSPPKSSTNHHQNGSSSTSHTNNNNNNKKKSSSNSSNGHHHQSRKAPAVSSLDFDDDTEETATTNTANTDHEMDFASQDDAPPVVTKNQKTNNNNNKQNGRSHSSTSNNKQSNGSLTAQQQERRQIIKQKELKAEKLAEEERERLLRTQMGDESLNRELYDHFNALQAVASQHKISLKLPELVVVGMQSDGKSSFVEALLGFQFNHVDTNIGTRRPLMLQMHHDPSRTKPYCVFQNEQQQQNGGGSSNQQQQQQPQAIHMDKPTPVHMLEHEIRRRTEQVCGEKGVSPVPICLHVYYKYCANLVIIDTPGFRKGDSDELSAKIEKMVMNLLKPQERIIVCLEQSTVEWCNTQVRPMIQRVDPNFSRTVFVCTKFNNRNNQFRDKEEVDKFLSTDGEVNNPKSVFFISLPSGHNARDLSEEEFKNKILEVYLQDYRHLSNIGFNQEKYKSQLGFYNLRRYLELMLNEKYKAALIPVLERIDHQIKKRQSLVDLKNQELIEAQNVDVEQKANQLLTNFVNLVVKCLNGTNMFPTSKNGQTLEEEREKAAVPWPNYSLDFKIRNSQYKLYGGAQLERLLAEFEVVAHSQEFPATSDDEVAVTIGLNSIHTMPDYDRGASELAQKKSKIVFQPLIDVLLARSRSIMRSMIVMVCGHLFHDNKQFKRVLQEMRNASDQFFDIVINDAKEKCELEFDTFTRVMDWELMGFGTSKQAHEYDLLNPTKEDTIKRVQNLTDDTVAEKMLLFTNDRSRELTEERCRKIKEAAARLFGGVRVLFVKYVRAKYLSFFLQPIFNKLEDHCRTYFHKLGANRVIELADGPNPALIQQTIQQNKTAIESLVEQREKSLKLYNKFKTASGKSSSREAL